MGYAVYITRAPHHVQGAQVPIPQEDWHALIENDPDLASAPSRPDLARWAGPSLLKSPQIDWANGNLFSRDPDHSVIRKLIELAGLLGGRVQGDDGELYAIERGRIVRVEPDEAVSEEPADTTPFRGVGQPELRGLDDAMGTDELEAALGALTSHAAEAQGRKEPEDPHASFARPPDEALEVEQGGPPKEAPFRVGQRVRTSWGRPGTIVAIDPDADWGMGRIEIKYDDGRTASTSCVAHGLEPA